MNGRRNQVIVGDARHVLPTLPHGSINCVITSPPYFNLRHYAVDDQIGLEQHVDEWVEELRGVIRQLARVLHPTGSLWLNLGDSFSRADRAGARPKSLLLAPERLALAMIDDGWTIRSKVIWAKTNAMPTSARDRLSCTYEVFYLAARSPKYFFDLDAIRVPLRSPMNAPSEAAERRARNARVPEWAGPLAGNNRGLDALKAIGLNGHPLGKNPGDVWTHATSNHRGIHHAMFPVDLIRRPLLASCPERVCTNCGQPWQRERTRRLGRLATIGELQPDCRCSAPSRAGVVLDPFIGAGTVAVAAEQSGRDWLGIELNADFARLAEQRITAERIRATKHNRTDTAA